MEGDKGAVLYTGPDGIGDYKTEVKDQFHIGVGTASTESTLGAGYICRGYSGQPFPINRVKAVGEVGWETSKIPFEKSGNRIKLQEFRQAAEDRYTHRYQDPFFGEPASDERELSALPQDKATRSPLPQEPTPKALTIKVPESSSVASSASTLPQS